MRNIPAIMIPIPGTGSQLLFVFGEKPAPLYPPSEQIFGIERVLGSICTLAPGADTWPITWLDDDKQYTSWGDDRGNRSGDIGVVENR